MFKTLIVEDNIPFRQSIKEILQTQFPSIAIEEAGDASVALEKVETFLPHLVFMDIKLPNGNGLSLTKKIKKDHPDISVIILTSYDFLEYRKAAEEYGANHFLSKAAVTKEEIVALVKSFLKKGDAGK
jgi:YesN/AraC family two-component response regulator